MPNAGAWLKAHKALLLTAAVLLLLDRATKVWALAVLPQKPIVFGKYLWLTYVENTGAAFGIFQNANMLLAVVMVLVIGYIIFSWKELARYGALATWGAGLILTGALGNLYDRITLGFVVDFLDLRVWPVFNVADSCITVGAILLGWVLLCKKPSPKENV